MDQVPPPVRAARRGGAGRHARRRTPTCVAAGQLAVEGLEPTDDLHASGALRLRIGAAVVRRALTTALARATEASQHERRIDVTVTVNGTRATASVEPRKTLADFLREDCGLTGTHLGASTACAARAPSSSTASRCARACMFAVQATGASITTVEGLATDGELESAAAALRDEHGFQCGFCTPGFVVSVTALLASNPDPTDQRSARAVGQPLPVHRLPGDHPRRAQRGGEIERAR